MNLIRTILLLIIFITPLKANTIYNLIKIPNLEIYEINTENKLSECKRLYDEGDIDSTLSLLGETDEVIENIRRRI